MLFCARALQGVALLVFLSAALRAQGAGAESLSSAEAVLMPANLAPADRFGKSVAIHGDTAVCGSPRDTRSAGTDSGSAYVFVRNGTTWSEQQQLIPSDPQLDDRFGFSTGVWGDTAVVSAHLEDRNGTTNAGAVYVFVRSGTTWTEQQKLTVSDAEVDARFGFSIAIWQDTIVVGAYLDDAPKIDQGSAYVFVRNGTTWTEEQKLTVSSLTGFDRFGGSVDVEGDTAVIGAYREDHPVLNEAGAAYVFVRNAGVWSEQQRLVASDANDFDDFGRSVSLSGETALIGAPIDGNTAAAQQGAGAAYAFVRSGTAWSEQQKLAPSDGLPADAFGQAVGLSGDTAVVGAPRDDLATGDDVGSAYTFTREGGAWSQQAKLFDVGATDVDYFGLAIAVLDDTALVGIPRWDMSETQVDMGLVAVFHLGTEAVLTYCTAGTSASGCQATLSASGLASISAPSGFTLTAANVEGSKDGAFYFGTTGKQANPWGNGTSFQCVAPPVTRTGILNGVGTVGLCDGSFARDLNAFWCPTCTFASKAPGAGTLVQTQLWYRDPDSTSNQKMSLSDAIEFVVAP
jgi:hypothetical protein